MNVNNEFRSKVDAAMRFDDRVDRDHTRGAVTAMEAAVSEFVRRLAVDALNQAKIAGHPGVIKRDDVSGAIMFNEKYDWLVPALPDCDLANEFTSAMLRTVNAEVAIQGGAQQMVAATQPQQLARQLPQAAAPGSTA